MIGIPDFWPFSKQASICAGWHELASKVDELESSLRQIDGSGLRKDSLSLRYEVLSGQPLKKVLVRAFALVREAARRNIGLRHFPVQVLGGIALHHGAIAVMQTGEGKTLTATLPLYLAALTGKGAHLATANDYLAARDAEAMGPVFRALGLDVGVVSSTSPRCDRQRAYRADVTYSTAKEIGFDFLRDRLLNRRIDDEGVAASEIADELDRASMEPVQRPLNFLLVDEADSILIDEARTPLIISSLPDNALETEALYRWASEAISQFKQDDDYELDDDRREVHLTTQGRRLTRKLSKPSELSSTPLQDIYDQLELALLVHHKFTRDRHYVVRNGEVVIVDEFTGRISEGRKWRAGIHQAIEARENLEISFETSEAARITIQDLCLRYEQLCGMTGTASSSSNELRKIYGTNVVDIPTNRPARRQQLADQVYGHDDAKWHAIVHEIVQMQSAGRPVLVGTRSIDKSEHLSELLTKTGIEHQVLNARHLEHEAKIVERAGAPHRVTVATNMAGRGTDIKLRPLARKNGGLHVIVSELHESARIDRQLIGRAGRQGDPGSFRYFMALDDEIIRTGFGPGLADRLRIRGANQKGQAKKTARILRQAQHRVEQKHFRGRKLLLFFEKQRQVAQREMGQDPYVDTIA